MSKFLSIVACIVFVASFLVSIEGRIGKFVFVKHFRLRRTKFFLFYFSIDNCFLLPPWGVCDNDNFLDCARQVRFAGIFQYIECCCTLANP